jgi:hypothetical protein
MTTFAQKVIASRIDFQYKAIENLSKRITNNSKLNFSLHRQAHEEMSPAYDRIGILEAVGAKFHFDGPKDILMENLKNFLVSEICWNFGNANMVKYVELARMIQELEMNEE